VGVQVPPPTLQRPPGQSAILFEVCGRLLPVCHPENAIILPTITLRPNADASEAKRALEERGRNIFGETHPTSEDVIRNPSHCGQESRRPTRDKGP
jgi:hypothetical protein